MSLFFFSSSSQCEMSFLIMISHSTFKLSEKKTEMELGTWKTTTKNCHLYLLRTKIYKAIQTVLVSKYFSVFFFFLVFYFNFIFLNSTLGNIQNTLCNVALLSL